jgi:hypothetical protein
MDTVVGQWADATCRGIRAGRSDPQAAGCLQQSVEDLDSKLYRTEAGTPVDIGEQVALQSLLFLEAREEVGDGLQPLL